MLGAAMIRANVLNRWAAWLFTIGLALGLTIDMATGAFFEESGDTPEVGFFVGPPLFCIGLIWLGYEMWKGRGTGTEPAAPPVAAMDEWPRWAWAALGLAPAAMSRLAQVCRRS